MTSAFVPRAVRLLRQAVHLSHEPRCGLGAAVGVAVRSVGMVLLVAMAGAGTACHPEAAPATATEAATPSKWSDGPTVAPRLRIEGEAALSEPSDGLPQIEPQVVVDPRDPDHLVAAAMSVSAKRWRIWLADSRDGGRTWRRRPSPAAPGTWRAFDPWLAWAPDGSALYLALAEMSLRDGAQQWRLPVFRSTDGGMSWSRWAEVPGRTLDRPVLLAGRSAVWVLATEAVEDVPIVVARAPAAETGDFAIRGRFRPASHNTILADAALTGDRRLVLSFTDRGSLQDHRPRTLFTVSYDDRTRRFGEPDGLGTALFIGSPRLAVDASPTSPRRGWLYAAWGDRSEQAVPSLRIAVSPDGGASWRAPVTIAPHDSDDSDDSDGADVTFVTVPSVAVDRRGRLAVTWREHTGTLETGCSTVHLAVSLDGGSTFPLRRRLTPKPSCPDRSANRIDLGGIPSLARWPGGGDYAALAVGSDGIFHPVWADAGTGPWHIRTAGVRLIPDRR